MSEPKTRLAVFAHWDKDSMVDPYVVHYLEALSKMADIIFCSDGSLSDAELAKIEPFTIARIAEPHGEYDFGSYKRGYLHASDILMDYDELVFANDSCYGPFFPFEELWQSMAAKECDFWGILEHFDPTIEKWHVQSYFLVFKRTVLSSGVLDSFLRRVRRERHKRDVIVKYEVGLSDALIKAGFRPSSLCPRSEQNLTHLGSAFGIIDRYRVPLLKKALLAKNPLRAPLLIDHLQAMEFDLTATPLWPMIRNNLKRTVGNHYFNCWFHTELIRGCFLHPNLLRYKEKPLRWMNVISIKIFGITLAFIPWKINFRRLRYERDPSFTITRQ